MTICLPIIRRNDQILGTGFFVRKYKDRGFVACTMHQLGMNTDSLGLLITTNEGNVVRPQSYIVDGLPIITAKIEHCDPILDFAILSFEMPQSSPVPNPMICEQIESIYVGQDVAVIGYPLSVIGSVVQTYEPCSVSARVSRQVVTGVSIEEFIVNKISFSGSSGSAVIDRRDNRIIGMIRGCIAPPAMIQTGSLPLGTDTNITIALASSNFAKTILKTVGG